MYERKIPLPIDCGLRLTREVLNGKWKAALLKAISLEIMRPSEITRLLPGATRRVINVQLKELEQHGLILRKIYPQLPLKVEYTLTTLGASIMPIIDAMDKWGDVNRSFLEQVVGQDREIIKTAQSLKELLP
jgi:DNA-binding HxlR family transcriptional regulator